MGRFSRREMVIGAALAGASLGSPLHAQVLKDIRDLKPGEFTWHPERSPRGPVAIVASIPEQLVHVYRNGVRIAVSTCSTGAPGHETPTGVFTVLQKDKHHRSSTYNNAPMPNMNRLTWGGIALHAGKLPGYPASHGCVRLPMAFSERLFGITHVGTPVILAGAYNDPWDLIHPGLVLDGSSGDRMAKAVAELSAKSHPSDWTDGQSYPITSLIASGADRTITLLEDGREIASARLSVNGMPQLGEHVFTLKNASNERGYAWQGITHHADPAQPGVPEENLLSRLRADKAFSEELSLRLHPGTLFIVTDLPSHPERRSGQDFVIVSSA